MKKKPKQENTDDPEESDSKPPETPSVTQTCKNGAASQPLKRGQKVIKQINLRSSYSHVLLTSRTLMLSPFFPEQAEEDEGQIQRPGWRGQRDDDEVIGGQYHSRFKCILRSSAWTFANNTSSPDQQPQERAAFPMSTYCTEKCLFLSSCVCHSHCRENSPQDPIKRRKQRRARKEKWKKKR